MRGRCCGVLVYSAAIFVFLLLLAYTSPVTCRHHLLEVASLTSSPSSNGTDQSDSALIFCKRDTCVLWKVCYCCLTEDEPNCYQRQDVCKANCLSCKPKCSRHHRLPKTNR
ncbi:hypothetical protein BDA96_08G206200 [Sorghum bicolor]|uniref:Bowman-Birk serine protease inhibitors family domain-containing protein n=2 Tax=Sorghum bicolor TaxID=4558 RepID=A0A921U7S4_SORBI|nr:hypothetical protein BDA96_08G206200 [Sorghum bicolor]KXG24126.1 hypothetical protein SORBI_3008G188300 [Sorghum bicolor]